MTGPARSSAGAGPWRGPCFRRSRSSRRARPERPRRRACRRGACRACTAPDRGPGPRCGGRGDRPGEATAPEPLRRHRPVQRLEPRRLGVGTLLARGIEVHHLSRKREPLRGKLARPDREPAVGLVGRSRAVHPPYAPWHAAGWRPEVNADHGRVAVRIREEGKWPIADAALHDFRIGRARDDEHAHIPLPQRGRRHPRLLRPLTSRRHQKRQHQDGRATHAKRHAAIVRAEVGTPKNHRLRA